MNISIKIKEECLKLTIKPRNTVKELVRMIIEKRPDLDEEAVNIFYQGALAQKWESMDDLEVTDGDSFICSITNIESVKPRHTSPTSAAAAAPKLVVTSTTARHLLFNLDLLQNSRSMSFDQHSSYHVQAAVVPNAAISLDHPSETEKYSLHVNQRSSYLAFNETVSFSSTYPPAASKKKLPETMTKTADHVFDFIDDDPDIRSSLSSLPRRPLRGPTTTTTASTQQSFTSVHHSNETESRSSGNNLSRSNLFDFDPDADLQAALEESRRSSFSESYISSTATSAYNFDAPDETEVARDKHTFHQAHTTTAGDAASAAAMHTETTTDSWFTSSLPSTDPFASLPSSIDLFAGRLDSYQESTDAQRHSKSFSAASKKVTHHSDAIPTRGKSFATSRESPAAASVSHNDQRSATSGNRQLFDPFIDRPHRGNPTTGRPIFRDKGTTKGSSPSGFTPSTGVDRYRNSSEPDPFRTQSQDQSTNGQDHFDPFNLFNRYSEPQVRQASRRSPTRKAELTDEDSEWDMMYLQACQVPERKATGPAKRDERRRSPSPSKTMPTSKSEAQLKMAQTWGRAPATAASSVHALHAEASHFPVQGVGPPQSRMQSFTQKYIPTTNPGNQQRGAPQSAGQESSRAVNGMARPAPAVTAAPKPLIPTVPAQRPRQRDHLDRDEKIDPQLARDLADIAALEDRLEQQESNDLAAAIQASMKLK